MTILAALATVAMKTILEVLAPLTAITHGTGDFNARSKSSTDMNPAGLAVHAAAIIPKVLATLAMTAAPAVLAMTTATAVPAMTAVLTILPTLAAIAVAGMTRI